MGEEVVDVGVCERVVLGGCEGGGVLGGVEGMGGGEGSVAGAVGREVVGGGAV